MFDIRKRKVNGKTITTFQQEIVHANILEVEVGTNGPHGGDTGNGGRSYFRLTDLGGTDMTVSTNERGDSVEIELGGDAELYTFIQALEFAVKILKYKTTDLEEDND